VGVRHRPQDRHPRSARGHAPGEVAAGSGHARHPGRLGHEAAGRRGRRRLRHQRTPAGRPGRASSPRIWTAVQRLAGSIRRRPRHSSPATTSDKSPGHGPGTRRRPLSRPNGSRGRTDESS
jgi:hypothetical protein